MLASLPLEISWSGEEISYTQVQHVEAKAVPSGFVSFLTSKVEIIVIGVILDRLLTINYAHMYLNTWRFCSITTEKHGGNLKTAKRMSIYRYYYSFYIITSLDKKCSTSCALAKVSL